MMKRPTTILLWLLTALTLLTLRAGVNVLRDQVTRPAEAHWADLGSADYPFRNLYVDNLVGGTNGGGSGGGGTTTVVFTNTVTLPAGSAAYCVNYGSVAGVYQLGIPQGTAGNPGTNLVTVNQFSNVVLSSKQITLLATNPITFATSNYLGRFSMLAGWKIFLPQLGGGGGTPSTNIFEQLCGSYNGSNSWFAITTNGMSVAYNGFATTSSISLSMSGAGGGAGSVTLYGIDHPELMGRTNYYFGQFNSFPDPIQPADAANKRYVDTAILNTLSPWIVSQDITGAMHNSYTFNLQAIADLVTKANYVRIDGFADDGTGLNGLLSIAQTNFAPGWNMQSSTNLVLVNGWTTFTNWTAITTNSGEVTFTIPYNFGYDAQFFRVAATGTNTIYLNAPTVIGIALSFWVQTNTPRFADLGSQKAGRLWVSNGFFYATGSTNGTTTYTKPIAP